MKTIPFPYDKIIISFVNWFFNQVTLLNESTIIIMDIWYSLPLAYRLILLIFLIIESILITYLGDN